MGKIKLPKSLLRVLFPKSKKKKADLRPIHEKHAVVSATKSHDVDVAKGKPDAPSKQGTHVIVTTSSEALQTAPSTSPTVASCEENAVNIVSMQFSFDDYDDASFASVKEKEVPSDVVDDCNDKCVVTDCKKDGDVTPAATDNACDVKDALTPLENSATDGVPDITNVQETTTSPTEPELNTLLLDEALPSSPSRELPHHSTPAAQRARLKALARQKRILSKCEERLNALAGTADAPLDQPKLHEKQRLIREKNKEKKNKLNLEKESATTATTTVTKEEKQFSTIVFYESNPTEEEINVFNAEQQPLSPLSTDTAETTPNNFIDTQGFPVGTIDSPPPSTTPAPISFFVLLLDPKSRIFELIEIDDMEKSSTIQQVLDTIPTKCTDERLLNMKYIGLCRPSDRVEFTDLAAIAFPPDSYLEPTASENQYITESDVLVAILHDSTGFQMCKISKPILKNNKFRDMVRRRRKTSTKKTSCSKSVEIIDETAATRNSIPAVIKTETAEEKKEKYDTLCKKLESLSKKLHRVDEEIMAGEVTLQPSSLVESAPPQDSKELTVNANTSALESSQEVAYRMSPKMVATELAQHIEDIFADHDVEILAVDADDDEESDDGTFVSARSHKSVRSVRSLMTKQMEMASKPKSRRKKKTNLFESDNEDALALQIEAMAVQAEEAFGGRYGRKSAVDIDVKEDVYEVPDMSDVIETDDAMEVIPEEFESSDILDTMKSLTRGSSSVDISNCTPSQKEAFSRNFLNTSTSMVSTMVAATHGRVNEVHVLQYLGCTIVCIAANFAQQRQEKQSAPPISPNFGARQIFQSAMFLAFMVNGQRYLAKVTKK